MTDSDGMSAPFFDINPDDSFFAVAVVNVEDESRLAVFSTDDKPILPDNGEQIKLEKVDVDSEGEFGKPNQSTSYRVVSREFKYTSLSVPREDEGSDAEGTQEDLSEGNLFGTGISLYVEPVDDSS